MAETAREFLCKLSGQIAFLYLLHYKLGLVPVCLLPKSKGELETNRNCGYYFHVPSSVEL